MKLRFDENDDLVIDDIPDDLMDLASKLAAKRGISDEDVWREIICQFAAPASKQASA